LSETDPDLARSRVPEDVGQRLLDNSEHCSFYLRCESRKIAGLHIE
jgi:hypothetical protein